MSSSVVKGIERIETQGALLRTEDHVHGTIVAGREELSVAAVRRTTELAEELKRRKPCAGTGVPLVGEGKGRQVIIRACSREVDDFARDEGELRLLLDKASRSRR